MDAVNFSVKNIITKLRISSAGLGWELGRIIYPRRKSMKKVSDSPRGVEDVSKS